MLTRAYTEWQESFVGKRDWKTIRNIGLLSQDDGLWYAYRGRRITGPWRIKLLRRRRQFKLLGGNAFRPAHESIPGNCFALYCIRHEGQIGVNKNHSKIDLQEKRNCRNKVSGRYEHNHVRRLVPIHEFQKFGIDCGIDRVSRLERYSRLLISRVYYLFRFLFLSWGKRECVWG